jgi:hypothetical protein
LNSLLGGISPLRSRNRSKQSSDASGQPHGHPTLAPRGTKEELGALSRRPSPVNDDGSDGVSTEISNRATGNRGTRIYSRIHSSRGNNDSTHMGSKDTGNGRDIRSSRQRSSRNRRNHPSLRSLPQAIAGGRDFAGNAP